MFLLIIILCVHVTVVPQFTTKASFLKLQCLISNILGAAKNNLLTLVRIVTLLDVRK